MRPLGVEWMLQGCFKVQKVEIALQALPKQTAGRRRARDKRRIPPANDSDVRCKQKWGCASSHEQVAA